VSKKIYVTKAQEIAARMLVARSAKSGKPVRSSVTKIASASGRAVTGTPPGTRLANQTG
jgi:hypothetical protein